MSEHRGKWLRQIALMPPTTIICEMADRIAELEAEVARLTSRLPLEAGEMVDAVSVMQKHSPKQVANFLLAEIIYHQQAKDRTEAAEAEVARLKSLRDGLQQNLDNRESLLQAAESKLRAIMGLPRHKTEVMFKSKKDGTLVRELREVVVIIADELEALLK